MTDQPYTVAGRRATAFEASRQMINDASANLHRFNGADSVDYAPGMEGVMQQQTGIMASVAESLMSIAITLHESVFENPPEPAS